MYKYSSKVHLLKTCQRKSTAVLLRETKGKRAADIFSKNYLQTCTIVVFFVFFFSSLQRKKESNRHEGYTFSHYKEVTILCHFSPLLLVHTWV